MAENELMGFARLSKNGGAVKLNISAEAFSKAQRYQSRDGKEFVSMIINLDRLSQLISGEKEVVAVVQIQQ